MADLDMGAHGGPIAAAAAAFATALTTWASRFFKAREQQAVATELALLRQELTALAKQIEKHENVNERLALVEASLKAMHERFDAVEKSRRRAR